MKLQNVTRKHVSYVELERDGKTHIGISVKDGSKYGLRPLIKNVKQQSLSHRSHCVAEGDVILSICGEDSKRMGRKEIRRLLKQAGFRIELKLEYEVHEACFDNIGIYRYERMSLNIRKESGSFGFILRKNDSTDSASTAEYPTITNIQSGGPADREKRLKDGDRLLKIDDQSMSWLSLREVSAILREKEVATFLFEYNTGIVDFCFKIGEKTELEIDCPDVDLGMVLGSSSENSRLSIREIQQGSLAQRCGAFHVGDVILLINDIDTALLTASKANSLLHHFRKEPGKLAFIPYMKGEQPHDKRCNKTNSSKLVKENCFSPHTSLSIDHSKKPMGRYLKLKNQATTSNERNRNSPSSSSSQIRSHTRRYQDAHQPVFNSPCSIHKAIFETSNFPQTFASDFDVQEFQTETISMFRDVVQDISNMQPFISYFDNEVERITEKDVDTSESRHNVRSQNISNIDRDRFSQLKATYSQVKNSAYIFCMHLVRNFKTFPSHFRNSSPIAKTRSNCENKGVTTSNLILQVIGDLTEIHLKQFVPKKLVDEISSRLDAVELDCWECRTACLSAFFLTQKVLLILSFNEPDVNMRYVIHMLIQNLMKLKIPCDDCKRPWCSVSQTEEEVLQNIPIEPKNPFSISRQNKNDESHPRNINMESRLTSQRNCFRGAAEPLIGLDFRTENAFFRLGQSPSQLGESPPASDVGANVGNVLGLNAESNRTPTNTPRRFTKNPGATRRRSLTKDDYCEWKNYCKSVQAKAHKGKNLVRIPMQTWKSNEVISADRCEFEMPPLTRSKSVIPNNRSPIEENCQTTTNLQFRKSTVPPTLRLDEQSNITGESFASDATIQPTYPIHADEKIKQKTQSTTTSALLRNKGSGYGLNFEFNALSDGTPTVPVITAVRHQSAAHECGILLKGDRILEINGRNLLGLSSPKIHEILQEAFVGDEVLLKVEFDIAVPEIKFGTFDVCIDKTIKPGLEFKEFQKGAPLVVKGVVKGSAAHRSGLLFPGDEILYTNCTRQEAYESCTCKYKRTELVILTVRREPSKDSPEVELETDIELDSICLHPNSSNSKDFVLYRTLVRTVNGTDARVLDHEFTLFQDPVQKDFGFLIGQNPVSGKVYITGIRPGGPADRSKAIKKNDRILEVNGTIIGNNNKSSVLSIFMQDNDRIDLITRRILRD